MSGRALVLAAGRGTRIAAVGNGVPKPLLPIAGKPVIVRILEWLVAAGTRTIWINLHHQPDAIRGVLGDGSAIGARITYSVEPRLLGTAGTFRHLASGSTDTTLVVYGDNLVRFDLAALQETHRRSRTPVTVALFDPTSHTNSRIAGGSVVLGGDGRVRQFVEGGSFSSQLVNAGVYLLEPAVATRIPAGYQDFGRDVFPALAADGLVQGHVIEPSGYCLGIDTPESYRIAESLVATNQLVLA